MPVENVPYDPDALFMEMATVLSTTDSNPWHQLERGEIPLQTFLDYVDERVPGGSTLFAVDSEHNVMGNLQLLDERIAVASELRAAGKRVGLVTNNVAEWQPLWRPRLPAEVFEIVIDSAQVGFRKPEPAIYELAMQELGVADPTAVVFIDDFEWNVTGATAVGMVGLHCTGTTDLRAELATLL